METDNKPSGKERRKERHKNLNLYIHFSVCQYSLDLESFVVVVVVFFFLTGCIVLHFYKAKGKRSKLLIKLYRLVPVSKQHICMNTLRWQSFQNRHLTRSQLLFPRGQIMIKNAKLTDSTLPLR